MTTSEVIQATMELEGNRKHLDVLTTIRNAVLNSHEEPTLFELGFVEVCAKLTAIEQLLIDFGRKQRIFEDRLAKLEVAQ